MLAPALLAQAASDIYLAEQLKGVEVTERIGEPFPLDVPFTDDNGRNVTLRQYFTPGVPVLITLNYADCPRLCSLQLSDLARALRGLEWKPGQQFQIVTISIDPAEDFKRARQSKIRFLGEAADAGADKGWHFLTSSDEKNVLGVAEALGYKYRYDAERREYIHKNAMFVVSGAGVITHYIRTLGFEPSLLQGYLAASAQDKLGTPWSEEGTGFGLNCFAMEYTDNIGRAFAIMRTGGGVVLAFFVSFVGYFWWREYRRSRLMKAEAA